MARILDANSLLVYLEKEPGHERIESLLTGAIERDENLLICAINYGEIYSIVIRECGQDTANQMERTLRTLPIEIIDVDINLAKEAARFKAIKLISSADSFAVALAKLRRGELITANKDLKVVEKDIKILWIN